VRGSGADLEALTRLVASGEVALTGDLDDETETSAGEAAPDSQPEPPVWNEGTEWGSSFAAPAGADDLVDSGDDLDDAMREQGGGEADATEQESEVAALRNAFATRPGEPTDDDVSDDATEDS
jgi:hypothetical protein